MSDDAVGVMFSIVIGYDDNVKRSLQSQRAFISFVYFGSPCLYHYERVSTKSNLLIG